MRTVLPLAATVALAVALACGNSLEPSTVVGTWYLQSYNDSAMPGVAPYRTATDSGFSNIDSVRLVLEDGATCTWLVHLADEAPNGTDDCTWTRDAGADDLLVTIFGGFELRGAASESALTVRDPNENQLVFGRDPAERGPVLPNPRR